MESSSSLDDLRMPVSQFFDSPDFSICQPVESSSRLDDAEITPSGSDEGREHMFDKVVNTSDVGKLNRLVVPKHFAEKYFPLDAAANDKGMLLSFEDRGGKLWQFRYSYWNSSQSYVMTKGWSRFVKEKRLNAGDTVSFCRGATEATRDRLFIDWKCRAVVHDSLPKVDRPSRAVQKRVRLFGVNLDTQQPQGGELTHDANAGAAGVESSAAASSPSSSQAEAHSSLDLGLRMRAQGKFSSTIPSVCHLYFLLHLLWLRLL